MALYEIERTDHAGPGEFVAATVLASGVALARKTVAHLRGVQPDGKNLKVTKIETAKVNKLLSVYFDERTEVNA